MKDVLIDLFLWGLGVFTGWNLCLAYRHYKISQMGKRAAEGRIDQFIKEVEKLHRELDPDGFVPFQHLKDNLLLDDKLYDGLLKTGSFPHERLRQRMTYLITNYPGGGV